MLRQFIAAIAVPLLLAGCTTAGGIPPPPTPAERAALEEARAGNAPATRLDAGIVSAADPRAAEAGAEMLRKDGSATDAAIATMLALTVVEPQSSGIGGGGFYVRGTMDGAVETIDGRETAPAGAGPGWFLDDGGKPLSRDEAIISGLSVGVPGNLALAAEAHRRHGKLAWKDLFAPAIGLARDGWTVTERFHRFLSRRPETAAHDAAGRALFFDTAGQPLPVGTHVRNPALAATLERIAAEGIAAFYEGEAAAAMAAKVRDETPRAGGMTPQDLSAYRAKLREPVCGPYRAYRICGMGPPSSGATTVLAILGQLELFDLAALGPGSPVAWHLFAESQRLAYADRALFLADEDFVEVPVERLTDPAYLRQRGALISPDRSMTEVGAGLDRLARSAGHHVPERGTSHFAVLDREGTAVSYTSTIEGPFGSGIVHGGFYLNNELTDFSFVAEEDGMPVANRVEGGKRPRSSMAPTLVYGPDGGLVLAVGAAGGSTIPVQVARVLIGFIDWDLPLSEALALPMLYSPEDMVIVEKGSVLEAMVPELRARGHGKVSAYALPLKVNAVAIVDGRAVGAADPRSEGAAVGE